MRFTSIATLLFIVFSAPAFASLPNAISVDNVTWKKVGQGTLSLLFLDVYDVALYTPSGIYSMNKPYALSVRYDMGFDASDIIDRSLEEMHKQAPLSTQEKKAFNAALLKAIPNVKSGDVIQAVIDIKKDIRFTHNAKKPVTISNKEFAKRFGDIWLSDKTSEPDLRAELLSR